MASEQLRRHGAEPARQLVFPVQLQVLQYRDQVQQYAAVAKQFDLRAVQHRGLVLAQGKLQQARCRRAQSAVGLVHPMAGQHHAFVAGQDEHLQRRVAAIDGNDLAIQRSQARQGGAVQAQDAVQAELDAGKEPAEQHQGLMPRCRATMPLVMLW
ncbi:hypothetical protein D9M71_103540 [compost metagenome]